MGRVTQLYAKLSQGVVNPITHILHYKSSTAPLFYYSGARSMSFGAGPMEYIGK